RGPAAPRARRPRPSRRRRRADVHLDDLADAQIGDVVEAEAGQRPLHRGALNVEDPRLESHEDTNLHERAESAGARSTRRLKTSWYASSTPPRSCRKRSLSSFVSVAASHSRHVSGEISSPR